MKPLPEFMECDTCRAKPGIPSLCRGCLTNRRTINKLRTIIEGLYEQIARQNASSVAYEEAERKL